MTVRKGTPISNSFDTIGRVQVFNGNILDGMRVKFVYLAPGNNNWQKSKASEVGPRSKRIVLPSKLGVPHGSAVQFIKDDKGNVDASERFMFKEESLAVANYIYRKGKLTLKEVGVPPWKNWSQTIQANLSEGNYFFPRNRDDLKNIVQKAVANHVKLRVSGQRHSQTPLVFDNQTPYTWLIDMSSYADLQNGTRRIILSENGNTVTVNSGVQVGELEGFLLRNNKMLPTLAVGGEFSIGGVTSVDVHGASVQEPIFAETATEYNIMGSTGEVISISAPVDSANRYDPFTVACVNIGALGVVTSVSLRVLEKPYANTLEPELFESDEFNFIDQSSFQKRTMQLLDEKDRIQTFWNPYDGSAFALTWKIVTPEKPILFDTPASTSALEDIVEDKKYGVPHEDSLESVAQLAQLAGQESSNSDIASAIISKGLEAIQVAFMKASRNCSELWLTKASRAIYMSYFFELPNLDKEGLRKTWQALSAVRKLLSDNDNSFLLSAPLEFRFIKGGKALLSGTYTTSENAYFVNMQIMSTIKDFEQDFSFSHPSAMMKFFSKVERAWYKLGGKPHGGKLFGFFDPSKPSVPTPPFNDSYLADLYMFRKERVDEFNKYRKQLDPSDTFCNTYVAKLLGMTT